MAESSNLRTPEFRVGMAAVFKPYVSKDNPGAEPKYLIRALFPHPAKMPPAYKAEYDKFVVTLKARVKAAIIEKWGADDKKWPKNLRLPFRDQGEKAYEGWEEGALWFTASAPKTSRPGLVSTKVGVDGKLMDIVDESEFYSGCYAWCTISVYAYAKAGNNGVGIGLQNIQKLRDGEPLSGRLKAQDEFEPVASAEEPAAVGAGGAMDLLN